MSDLKTEIIALANYADFSKNGKLSLSGIFDEIYTRKTPASFVRGFLCFTVSGAEPNKKYTLRAEIEDSNKKSVLAQDVNFVTGAKGKANYIAELVGLPLPSAGEYKVYLKHGKEVIGDTKFYVSLVESDGGKGGTAR